MKTITLLLISSLYGVASYSQSAAKLESDTLYYAGLKFYKGQVLRTGYGTGVDGKFIFIKAVNKNMDFINAPADLSKTQGIVLNVRMKDGIGSISLTVEKLKFPLSIDIEGAVDKKELITN